MPHPDSGTVPGQQCPRSESTTVSRIDNMTREVITTKAKNNLTREVTTLSPEISTSQGRKPHNHQL